MTRKKGQHSHYLANPLLLGGATRKGESTGPSCGFVKLFVVLVGLILFGRLRKDLVFLVSLSGGGLWRGGSVEKTRGSGRLRCRLWSGLRCLHGLHRLRPCVGFRRSRLILRASHGLRRLG